MIQPNNHGISIIEVLVAAVLLAGVSMAAASTINFLFRGQRAVAKRNDVEGIRNSLLQSIDCNQTFTVAGGNLPGPAVVVAADCTGAVAGRKSILLRNRSGAPLTAPLIATPGLFNGAGRLFGDYYVHAYCDSANPSLVIRVAKGNGTAFSPDATTSDVFDFLKRPNPLFGTAPSGLAGPTICGAQIAPAAGPVGKLVGNIFESAVTTGMTQEPATCGAWIVAGINTCRYRADSPACPAGTRIIGVGQASCGGFSGEVLGAHVQAGLNSVHLSCRMYFPSTGTAPNTVTFGAVSAMCMELLTPP